MVPLSPRRLAEAFDVFATPRALLATVDEVTSDDESNPKFKLHESAVNGLSSSASSSCSSGASPRELQKPSGLSEEVSAFYVLGFSRRHGVECWSSGRRWRT